MDGGVVVSCELVVSGSDPAEILETTEHPLDAVALSIKVPIVRDWHVAASGRRDDGKYASFGEALAQGVGVVGTISEEMGDRACAGDQRGGHGTVVDVAGAEPQHTRPAGLVRQGVDFGGATAAGSADRLREVPPFAPAAERWALMWVASIAPPPHTPLMPVSAWKTSNQTPCWLQR